MRFLATRREWRATRCRRHWPRAWISGLTTRWADYYDTGESIAIYMIDEAIEDVNDENNLAAWERKIIAAILERPVIEKILAHLGLDPQPPPKGRVREAVPHFAA